MQFLSLLMLIIFSLPNATTITPDSKISNHLSAHNVEDCISSDEKSLFTLINSYRKSKKLPKIDFSQALSEVARAHAQDLMDHYDLSQRETCNPHSWSEEGEWTGCCYDDQHKNPNCMWDKPAEITGYAGPGYEIVYWNSDYAGPEKALTAWKKSGAHNPVMINSGIWEQATWQAMGVAIVDQYAVVWFGEVPDEQNNAEPCS